VLKGNGGLDSIRGGDGNDAIHVLNADVSRFTHVDGGNGSDTLYFDATHNEAMEMSDFKGKISGIETISLQNGFQDTVILRLADVLDIDAHDANVGGKATLDNTLKFDGEAGDKLALATADGWSAADTSTLPGYAIYTHADVKIAVDTHIAVVSG